MLKVVRRSESLRDKVLFFAGVLAAVSLAYGQNATGSGESVDGDDQAKQSDYGNRRDGVRRSPPDDT